MKSSALSGIIESFSGDLWAKRKIEEKGWKVDEMKSTVNRSIHEILEEFLVEQQARLSSKTYSGYEEAIYYFEEYLNGWANI